jgi:hypothetical protein
MRDTRSPPLKLHTSTVPSFVVSVSFLLAVRFIRERQLVMQQLLKNGRCEHIPSHQKSKTHPEASFAEGALLAGFDA